MLQGGLYCDVHDGDGPYLLLVHGMLASRAQWQLNLPALRRVCRPVVVELLGHGRSLAPEVVEPYRPESYVAAFDCIRSRLGVSEWLVCGQSLGAALTLRYALDHPERVRAQIFTNSNSALASRARSERMRAGLAELAEGLLSGGLPALEQMRVHPRRARHLPAEVREALLADAARADPRGIALTCLHTVANSSVRDRIEANRVPALLVQGSLERSFAEAAEFARSAMPRLEIVRAEAGHAVNAGAAERFNREVSRFIRATARGASPRAAGE